MGDLGGGTGALWPVLMCSTLSSTRPSISAASDTERGLTTPPSSGDTESTPPTLGKGAAAWRVCMHCSLSRAREAESAGSAFAAPVSYVGNKPDVASHSNSAADKRQIGRGRPKPDGGAAPQLAED